MADTEEVLPASHTGTAGLREEVTALRLVSLVITLGVAVTDVLLAEVFSLVSFTSPLLWRKELLQVQN